MKRLLLLALLASACDRGQSARTTHVVRDSAGVEIVESSRPVADSASRPHLSGEPLLAIGAVQGDSAYLFHGILGARRLSDGRFVVANRGTSEVRFFDPNGRFLFEVGREGDGPGEYRFMSLFSTRAGDTIVVSDARGMTVLDPQGRFVRRNRPRSADTTRERDVVEAHRLPWAQSSEWTAFSPGGQWLGSVRMRERFTPHQLGRDFVLGAWRDEDGVEYVHLYRVENPNARDD